MSKTRRSKTAARTVPTATMPLLAEAAEAGLRQRQAQRGIANFQGGIEELRQLLSADELRWLVRYIADGATCQVVADEEGCPRRTMHYRIRAAIRRLNQAGIPIVAPGRGRKPKIRLLRCNPRAMDRLICTGRVPDSSVMQGHWADAGKQDGDGYGDDD